MKPRIALAFGATLTIALSPAALTVPLLSLARQHITIQTGDARTCTALDHHDHAALTQWAPYADPALRHYALMLAAGDTTVTRHLRHDCHPDE